MSFSLSVTSEDNRSISNTFLQFKTKIKFIYVQLQQNNVIAIFQGLIKRFLALTKYELQGHGHDLD